MSWIAVHDTSGTGLNIIKSIIPWDDGGWYDDPGDGDKNYDLSFADIGTTSYSIALGSGSTDRALSYHSSTKSSTGFTIDTNANGVLPVGSEVSVIIFY